MINNIWLTVNRTCNFRCPWCYAEDTKYSKNDDMALSLAKDLIDFSKSLKVKNILLIGGEPTYYPHLFELIDYIKKRELKSVLVTNGYRFKDLEFVREMEMSGLTTIGMSIKAANAKQQEELTKTHTFDDIKQAIKNLSTMKNVKVGYSTVISKSTMNNMEEFAQMIADLDGTKHLVYSTCNPMFNEKGNVNNSCVPAHQDLINVIVTKFDKICEILNDRVVLEQSLASCLWPESFIKKIKEKNQISFGCHLQHRTGLVFDKDGKVIPCNALPSFPMGQYGVDFENKEDFERFWMSKELINLYDKIYEYPITKCQSCDSYLECGGGCPLKWFAYNAKEALGAAA